MLDTSAALVWVSLAVGVAAIITFVMQRREVAMSDGRKQQLIEELRKDVDHLYDKVRKVEDSSKCHDTDLAEVKTDIKHILNTLARIEAKLDKSSEASA